MEELVTEHTEVLLEAFWTPQKYHILEQMLVNPFSVVYSEKVILCYFILIKIIGQIPSWYTLKYLYQPFSTGSVLRYIKKAAVGLSCMPSVTFQSGSVPHLTDCLGV